MNRSRLLMAGLVALLGVAGCDPPPAPPVEPKVSVVDASAPAPAPTPTAKQDPPAGSPSTLKGTFAKKPFVAVVTRAIPHRDDQMEVTVASYAFTCAEWGKDDRPGPRIVLLARRSDAKGKNVSDTSAAAAMFTPTGKLTDGVVATSAKVETLIAPGPTTMGRLRIDAKFPGGGRLEGETDVVLCTD